MKRTVCLLCIAVILCLVAARPICGAQPLVFDQALRAAAQKVELEDSAVPLARAQLQYLESTSRRKFEFRPQIGLLSFSNPAVLASSLGLGLLAGFQNAPSKYAMQNARLDLALAELNRDRAKLRAQIETIHRFLDLLEKQQIAGQVCATSRETDNRLTKINILIQHHVLTAVDRVSHQQEALDRRAECSQAELQRKLASLQLALFVGDSDSRADLRVLDPVSPGLDLEHPLPSSENLLTAAMTFRTEPKEVRATVDSIRKARPRSRWRPTAFLLGFRNLSESAASGTRSYDGSLLGGNILTPEFTWSLPLRQSGESDAARAVLEAKIRTVEAQLTGIQDDLRSQFDTLRILSDGHREKLLIARQKRSLAVEGQMLVAARFQNGLGSPAVVDEAERLALLAETDYIRTSFQLKASVYSVLVLCGAHEQPVQQQARMLRGQPIPTGDGL